MRLCDPNLVDQFYDSSQVEPILTNLASVRNDLFTSASIAQRYESLTLQDEDGVVVLLHGSFSLLRMRENGFSAQA